MGAQSAPGLLEGVEDFVLGYRLIDAALQDPLRATAADRDRLVGREQRHIDPLQFPLDRQTFVSAASDTCDGFADYDVEPAVGVLGFIQ
nr:hypothetical protein [Nocardia thailandica]